MNSVCLAFIDLFLRQELLFRCTSCATFTRAHTQAHTKHYIQSLSISRAFHPSECVCVCVFFAHLVLPAAIFIIGHSVNCWYCVVVRRTLTHAADDVSGLHLEQLPAAESVRCCQRVQLICKRWWRQWQPAIANWHRGEEARDREREKKQQPQITEKARFSINAVNDLSKHAGKSAYMIGDGAGAARKTRDSGEELCA